VVADGDRPYRFTDAITNYSLRLHIRHRSDPDRPIADDIFHQITFKNQSYDTFI